MEIGKQTKEIMTNEIDLKILRILLIRNYSLTDLAKEVGIAYKNLLPHVRKLEKARWLKTKKKKKTRGQKVMVSREGATGKNFVEIGKKVKKEVLEVVEELNKKSTPEAVSYITNISIRGVWRILLKDLLNKGYVQAKFELTKEGKKHLEELKKTDKARF